MDLKKLNKITVKNCFFSPKKYIFFEFFTENVLKTLLRGRETTRKNYRVVFEKFFKYVVFFDFACPSTIHHPPSVNTSWRPAWNPGGWSNRQHGDAFLKYYILCSIIGIRIRIRVGNQFFFTLSHFIFSFFLFFSRLFSFFWLHTLKNMIFKEIFTLRFKIQYVQD